VTILAADVGRVNYGSNIPLDSIKAAKGKVFYKGAIVIVTIADGLARPAGDASQLSTSKVMGVAAYSLDTTNDVNDGDSSVYIQPGTLGDFDNGDTIAEAKVGQTFYVTDTNTVNLTAGSLPTGGTIYGIADDGLTVICQFEVVR
jgi:hypothetical protein